LWWEQTVLPSRVTVHPGPVAGAVEAPGSKSWAHRLLLLALLARGPSRLSNLPRGDDVEATLRAVEAFGAKVTRSGGTVSVEPPSRLRWPRCIDAGESGTTARLVAAPASLLDKPVLVYGRGRLHRRPVRPLLEALGGLGVAWLDTGSCCPPYVVRGPARGGRAVVDAGLSSQFLSSLLILAAGLGGLEVEATGVSSRPYVDITVEALRLAGVSVVRMGYTLFRVEGRPAGVEARIPGDWSSAAPLLAAAAASGGEVLVTGLEPRDPQPDRRITTVLASMGARCLHGGLGALCTGPGPGGLAGFEACIEDSPDLAPVLAALASIACGVSRICCAARLRLKESDRVATALDLAERAGAEAWLEEEPGKGLCIAVRGRCGPPRGGVYSSHRDHRVAMAAAVLGLAAEAPVTIEGADAVAKSYPGFWDALTALGARVEPA